MVHDADGAHHVISCLDLRPVSESFNLSQLEHLTSRREPRHARIHTLNHQFREWSMFDMLPH